MPYGDGEYGKETYGEQGAAPQPGGDPKTHLPSNFDKRLLQLIEAPSNKQNNRFMQAWRRAEGGLAKWNPLNTTLALSGTVNWTESVDYNSIGVKNYKYAIVGIVASVLTLNQRSADGSIRFGALMADLKKGSYTAEQLVTRNSAQLKLWGTDPDLMLQVLKSIP